MSFLVSHYLPWVAVALLLGLAVGWTCAERRRPSQPAPILILALLGAALALWIAFAHMLPGRIGHGLEVLLLLLVGYVFGALIGEPLRLAFAPPHTPRGAGAEQAAVALALPPSMAAGVASTAPATQAALALASVRKGAAEPALTAIAGVGPNLESQLVAMGVTKVSELANWGAEDAAHIGQRLGSPGRVEREMWIAQARLLSSGVETSHSIAQRMGRVQAREADAPLDDARVAGLRHELEDLSETAGVSAFSFAAPRRADAMLVDANAQERVSDDHKPPLLAVAPAEGADDLKLIWGVGPKLESMLNELGIYRFAQIAEWSEMNLRWVDQNLKVFRGRAERDRWIDQAKKLAGGWRPDGDVGERFSG